MTKLDHDVFRKLENFLPIKLISVEQEPLSPRHLIGLSLQLQVEYEKA